MERRAPKLTIGRILRSNLACGAKRLHLHFHSQLGDSSPDADTDDAFRIIAQRS